MALPGAQALTVELIPHCTSVLRDGWAGSHDVRPLAELGMRQAQALVASIGGTVDGVYSSPTARCRQTVGPLAAAVGLPVRDLAELYEAWDFGELAGVDDVGADLVGGAFDAGVEGAHVGRPGHVEVGEPHGGGLGAGDADGDQRHGGQGQHGDIGGFGEQGVHRSILLTGSCGEPGV